MYTQCRCEHFVSGGVWGGWLPKCYQMYKHFSGHIIIFPKIQLFSKFTFSCPENYLKSPENLLQIYLNLPKSALEIYLKFLMSNYQGCCTPPPPPPPPSEFQANTLWFIVHVFHLPKYCASYSRAFCCCHDLAWFNLWIFII
jgi:hypothetical protein